MISKSKILLASTALIAVAGVANAADTAVNTSGAVTGTDATELTLTDADTSTSVTAGDTISTDADIAAELNTGNTGVVITSSVAGTTLAIDHDVSTSGATAISVTGASTTNVDASITVTGATNAIATVGDIATTTVVSGTLSGAFNAASAATAATSLTVSSAGTVGDVTVGNGDATIAISGTAANIVTGDGTNGVTLTAGTVANVTGGAGTDTLTSTGASSVTGDVTAFEAINVTTGTLDANGSLTASTTTVSAGATLDMATGESITGTTTVHGTLATAGTVTLNGHLDARSTSTIGNVTIGGTNTVAIASGATTGTITGTGNDDDVNLTGAHNMSDLDLVGMRTLDADGALTLDGTTVIADTAIAALVIDGTNGSLVTNGNVIDADITLETGSTVDGALALGNVTGHTITANGQTLASVAGGTGTDTFVAASGVTTVTGALSAMETTTVTGDLVVGGTTAPTTGLLVSGAFTSDDVTATNATVNSDAAATIGGTSAAQTLTVGGDLTIASGTTTISGGTATTDVTGNITVGAVNAGTGAHLIAGTLADVDTKQANITLDLDTDFAASGKLTTTSALDFGTTKVALTSAQGATVVGTYENIVKGASAVALTADNNSTSNALYTYTWTKDGNDYDLAVALKEAGVTTLEGASSTGFKALAAQLENTGAGSSTNTADLYKEVFAQSNTEKALEGVASDVTGGLSQALINSVQGTSKSIDSRLASLRGHSGVAAGDMAANGSMWVKAFGTTATQDAQTGSAGYDGETFGVTYGVDSDNIVEGATVGLAISYADSNVDTAAGSDTDITSYQVTGYGSKDLGDRTYVDAQVGFAYNDYESSRTSLGDTYKGDFDGFQGMASVEAGRSYDWNGATVTPKAGLQYIMNSTDKYTETGAGANALTVDNEDTSALYARVGADMAWDMSTESGIQYRPFVKAGLSYDLIGDEAEARSSFSTGNAFTVKGAEAEEFAVELGAGLEVFSTNGVDVTLGYDAVLKDNYDAHTGSVKARWAF